MKKVLLTFLVLGAQLFCAGNDFFPPKGMPSIEASDEEIIAWLNTKGNTRHIEEYAKRVEAANKKKVKKNPLSILKKKDAPKKVPGGIRFKLIENPYHENKESVFTEVIEIPAAKDRIIEMGDMHGLVRDKLTPEGKAVLKSWMGREGIEWEKEYMGWKPGDHIQERVLNAEEQEEEAQTDAEWRVRRQQNIANKDAALSRKMRANLENALIKLTEEYSLKEINRARKNLYKEFKEQEELQRLIKK